MAAAETRQGAVAGPLEGVDVAVLAGGLGTRIRGVLGDTPKVLAPIGGRPFLSHLFDWLRRFGARKIVLCLGHGAERVTEYLQTCPPAGMTVIPVVEPAPLGTAGALRFARPRLDSDPVLALNGDTFFDADLGAFVGGHPTGGISLMCAEVPSIARFGSVVLDDAGHVERFVEKDPTRDQPGLISAGMYLFSQAALDRLTALPGSSLERDFLQIMPPGAIRAVAAQGRFIDIGTPESLAAADDVIIPAEPG